MSCSYNLVTDNNHSHFCFSDVLIIELNLSTNRVNIKFKGENQVDIFVTCSSREDAENIYARLIRERERYLEECKNGLGAKAHCH